MIEYVSCIYIKQSFAEFQKIVDINKSQSLLGTFNQ